MSLEAEVGYFLHEEIALELSEDEQNLHENKPLASFEEDFSHDQLESGAFDSVVILLVVIFRDICCAIIYLGTSVQPQHAGIVRNM